MSATERLDSEIRFHDGQARERAAWFGSRCEKLRFHDDAYLNHETWIRPAFDRLGSLDGLDVLDYGCGHGMASVVLARRGGRVTAFDLSGGYVAEARARADANGVAVDSVQADGERLPFADACFDRVWGNAVLHHLDLRRAASELKRVLRPGGRAVFCEPWGENPLLEWARRYLPYAGKQRTPHEEPFRSMHIAQLRAIFPQVETRGFQLLSMVRRVARGRWISSLEGWDRRLLERWPRLQLYARYMVFTLHV